MDKKIVVIGLGSMGQRRIRILKALYPEYKIIGIDANKTRAMQVQKDYEIEIYENISEMEVPVYAAFICTSPESHHELIRVCLERGCHVFSEINLMDTDYEKNIKLAKAQGKVLFLSSTPLYRDEIQYIFRRVKSDNRKKIYLYHVGQYLPDWHPWDNLKDFFVSKKETNGCRELMAIELPWIITVFGKVAEAKTIKSSFARLDIEFPDTYIIQLFHADGTIGNLVFDVVSRKAVRKLEIYNESMYLAWDGTPDSVIEKDVEKQTEKKIDFSNYIHDERYGAFINEAAYMREVEAFFETIDGKEMPYGFTEDQKVLDLINKIEGKL